MAGLSQTSIAAVIGAEIQTLSVTDPAAADLLRDNLKSREGRYRLNAMIADGVDYAAFAFSYAERDDFEKAVEVMADDVPDDMRALRRSVFENCICAALKTRQFGKIVDNQELLSRIEMFHAKNTPATIATPRP